MTSKFQQELIDRRKAKEREAVERDLNARLSLGATPPQWNNKPPVAAATVTPTPATNGFDPSLIPDVPAFERTASDDALDQIIANLPVTQAYRRWIPKGEPEFRYEGQRESIMIRCPFPNHVDQTASAWCNLDKNVWYCEPCQYGGDAFDLAAIHFGYPVPHYKKNGQFPKLRQQMAADFGIEIVRGVNGKEYTVQNSATAQATPATANGSVPYQNGHQAEPAIPKARPQIPGVLSFAMPIPGQKASPESEPAPKVQAPPMVPTPVSPVVPPTLSIAPAPIPPVVQPPAPAAPEPTAPPVAPPVTPPVVAPVAPPVPQMLAPQAPQVPQIPGLQPISLGSLGVTGLVPPGAPPHQVTYAPQMQVVEPDALTLGKYGLNEDGDDDGSSNFSGIALPWRSITPDGTFLGKYMALTTEDDCPEEYHYFSGLLALSLAAGRDVRLSDRRPVKGNIFVCLLGDTGDGKSNAKSYMTELIAKALPYDHEDPLNNGVNNVTNPASSEYMVRQFMKQAKDLTNPTVPAINMPVRGLIQFEELATLMKRSSNPSSTLTQFMIEFYDGRHEIKTGSLMRGDFIARDAFASGLSTTQPKALRAIITQELVDNGFMNRWIFATGKQKYSDPIVPEFELDVDPLILPLQKVMGWAGTVNGTIGWEPAALRLASDFIIGEIRPMKSADETGLFSRIDLLFKKMILLNTINLNRNSVPAEAVEWAIGAHRYLMDTYGSLDKAVHNSVDEDLSRSVIKAILAITTKTKRPPTMRQIADRVGTRKFTGEQIIRCVQTMDKIGTLEELPPAPGPGRKATRYQVSTS